MLENAHGAGETTRKKLHNVFVTGAAGRLGRFAVPLLEHAGYHVVGVDVQGDGAKVRELNLLDNAAVHRAMQDCHAVVHLGNHSAQQVRPPAQLFNENCTMTMNVFDTARQMGIRKILYASSIQVVASEHLPNYTTRNPRLAYLPLDGNLPPDPTNSYALSKYVGELTLTQWATELDLEAVSLRYPYLADFTSPRWPAHRHNIIHKDPTPTTVAQGFSWLSFPDAATLLLALLPTTWKGHRIYYPAAPTPRSPQTVHELLQKHYQNTPRKPGFENAIDSLIDITAITNDTGWTPKDKTF
jgi:nucleoside-diphosphate-sugar epimerase